MSGNSSIKINNLPAKPIPDASDGLVAWSSVSNAVVIIPISGIFSTTNSSLQVTDLHITDNSTPINSVQNTSPGKIWSDGTYLYVGVANNVIKRVALSPF